MGVIRPAEEEAGAAGVQVRGRGAQAGAAQSAGRVLPGHHHPDPGDGGAVSGADPHPEGPDDRGPGPDEPYCQLSPGGLPHVGGATAGEEDPAAVAGAAVCGLAAACRGCHVLLPWCKTVTSTQMLLCLIVPISNTSF